MTENEAEFLDFEHFRVPIVDGRPLELGRGAMGITYKAYDQSLHIDVALKVINSAILSGGNIRERFMREARAAASLRHPCVAAVTYLGEQGDDVFYSMEFVEGETVEARIRREGSMPVKLALHIVAEVASALTAAEKQNLVHRDIKPSNIMLVAGDDPEPDVKVIDFGLAKNIAGTDASATLTQGGFLGTPHFASPEQLEESHVDTRSDIYSLGVTLFYMLAGHTPFSGSTAQVMSQQLSREPPIEELSAQPEPVLALLRRMLAKKPSGRPEGAAALRRQTLNCLEAVKILERTGALPPAPPPPVAPATAAATMPADDESMATMIAPDLVLEPGEVVLERFELGSRIAASAAVVRFAATDRQRDGHPVEAIFFEPTAAGQTQLATNFEQHAAALAGVSAPAIESVLVQTRIGSRFFVCVDRPAGTSLLNVLKARRSLPLAEALLILRPLAEAADALAEKKLPHPGFSLFDIRLTPAGDPATPLSAWAPFGVKFDALRAASFDIAPLEGTLVKPAGASDESAAPAHPITSLASLAYEILGGSRIDSFHDRWTPLAELSQGGNLIIKRGLESPGAFSSGTQFIDSLGGNTVVLTPSGSATRPPPAPGAAPAPPSLPVAITPPPLPPKKSSAAPLVITLAIVLLLIGGGAAGLWFSGILGPKSPVAVPAEPAEIDTTPRVVREPNEPEPTPAEPTGREIYQTAFDRARQLELDAEYDDALTAYAELADSHPEDRDLFTAMERIASAISARFPDGVPAEDFPALRAPLEAAARHNSVTAQFLVGRALIDPEPTEAIKWLIGAAENGQSQAMVLAGLMLSNGRGVPKPDQEQAVGWFQQAADRRDMNGTFYLADSYLNGKGVPRDEKRAAELLTIAADLGDDRAMDWLGDMYRKGNGVPTDLKKAFDYFSKAVEQGNRSALAGLGVMHMLGEYVEPDPDKAVSFWKQGAEQGDASCMFLYATSIDDPERDNDKTMWYVRAAQAGDNRAMQWCIENDVSFAETTPEQTP